MRTILVRQLWLLLLCAVVACDNRRALGGRMALSANPVVLTPSPPLAVNGPKHELCLALDAGDAVPMTSSDRENRVVTKAGAKVRLQAIFEDVEGRQYGPMIPRILISGKAGWGTVCFTPDLGRAAVRRVELSADGRLIVDAVTWFSGEHHAFL